MASNPCHQVDHDSSLSWGLTASPPTNPPTRQDAPSCPTTSSTSSWDVTTFPETSHLLPHDRNGDWRTNTAALIKHPGATASSLHSTLSWPHLRAALTSAVDLACETVEHNINHAFAGHDLPAMHDRVMNLVPPVTLPSFREVSRGVDAVSDRVQALIQRQCSASLVDEDLPCDEVWFARHMSAKARRALVSQGICQKWQILATRETVEWHAQLENALARMYVEEKGKFSVAKMFDMRPVWRGDVEMGMWRLDLEVVGDEGKRVCVGVSFGLLENMGRVRVKSVERGVVEVGEWMAVE
jgi:hypothetical protein